MGGPRAVFLLGFGAPDGPAAVAPFLARVLGRPPAPGLVAAVSARYQALGGRSPLPELAGRLAAAVAARLRPRGDYRVYVGMLHWHPFIAEAAAAAVAAGVEGAVAISLSPHRSRVTTDAYERALAQALADLGRPFPVVPAPDWHLHPGYLDALAGAVAATLASVPAGRRPRVVFTAHSLPLRLAAGGDPYVDQVQATAGAVAARLGLADWVLAFQSRGAGEGEWLRPELDEVLAEAAAGADGVVVVPVGFLLDHLETLYDLDILHRRRAEELGLAFHRCPCLNDSPALAAALADVALSALGEHPLPPSGTGGAAAGRPAGAAGAAGDPR